MFLKVHACIDNYQMRSLAKSVGLENDKQHLNDKISPLT